MLPHEVNTPEKAVAYLADCCLATVASMSALKSRKKGEYARHILIAQKACDFMENMGIDAKGTRAEEILGKCLTVREWADSLEYRYRTK